MGRRGAGVVGTIKGKPWAKGPPLGVAKGPVCPVEIVLPGRTVLIKKMIGHQGKATGHTEGKKMNCKLRFTPYTKEKNVLQGVLINISVEIFCFFVLTAVRGAEI